MPTIDNLALHLFPEDLDSPAIKEIPEPSEDSNDPGQSCFPKSLVDLVRESVG